MKFINIILSISISTLAYGQNKNLLTELKPIEADFIYKINDSLEFKGTRIICTLPVRTFFTDIIYNESTNILSVAGFFYSWWRNDFDVAVSMKLFSAASSHFVFAKTIEKNVHSHMDGTFLVYTMTFDEFRKRQLNPYNKAARGIMHP